MLSREQDNKSFFKEASLANQKANMSANRQNFKSSFSQDLRYNKELNNASMYKYIKNTDSIQLQGTGKMRQPWLSTLTVSWLISPQSAYHDIISARQQCRPVIPLHSLYPVSCSRYPAEHCNQDEAW